MFYIFDRESDEHIEWDMHSRQCGDIVGFRGELRWFKLLSDSYSYSYFSDIEITEEINNWAKLNNIDMMSPLTEGEKILIKLTFG